MRFLFPFITCVLLAPAGNSQSLPPFSMLSGLVSQAFQVLEVESGYMVTSAIPYPNYAAAIHKIDHSGELVGSLLLSSDSVSYFSPRLASHAGRHFILCLSQLAPGSGASPSEIAASSSRVLLEVADDMTLIGVRHYQTLPQGNLYGALVQVNVVSLNIFLPGSVRAANNRVYSIDNLTIFGEDFTLLGRATAFEEFDVDGPGFSMAQVEGVGGFISSAMADDGFYIFGDVGGTPLPGGGLFDIQAVAEYDLSGLEMNAYNYDATGSGAFGSGSVGQVRGDLIYTSYYGQSFAAPGCDGEAATIDVRHRDGFSPAHPRFKIPDCGFKVACREPFLFDRDGDGYQFVAVGNQGTVALYRYDEGHDMVSRHLYDLPNHFVMGIHSTPEDGVLLACLEVVFSGGTSSSHIMLYKINPDGTVGSVTRLPAASSFTVYPNPTTDVAYVNGALPPGTRVAVSDMQGRLLGTHILDSGGSVGLGHLPAGTYVLTAVEPSGHLIGSQAVVRN